MNEWVAMNELIEGTRVVNAMLHYRPVTLCWNLFLETLKKCFSTVRVARLEIPLRPRVYSVIFIPLLFTFCEGPSFQTVQHKTRVAYQ